MPQFDFSIVAARLLDTLYDLAAALPMLLLALLIVWLGWKLGGWLSGRPVIARVVDRNPLLIDVARTTTRWLVTAMAVLLALEIMDATAIVGAMLGTAGIVGVAIGFAFKDTLENYLAGVLMSFRQPFAPRDEVVIDGETGTVIALTSRATILMTPDGNHLRLPNAKVFRSVILNYTRNPNRRFEFDVGIGVQEDLIQAQQIGLEQLRGLPGVLSSPPPQALIVSLADSSVTLRFRGWVDQREHNFWMVRSEAIRLAKVALDDAGMDMPEPTYRVQLHDGRAAIEAAAKAPAAAIPKPKTLPAELAAPDTRARSELDEQIDRDQQQSGSANLLDADAPRE